VADDSKSYEADKNLKWIHPDDEAPPRGKKIALRTIGGMQVTGEWRNDGGFTHWQRLFTLDKELEALRELQRLGQEMGMYD
jgi:hypothetical protein